MKSTKLISIVAAGLLSTQLAGAEPLWPPETFSCYYGGITPEAVQRLQNYDLLVLHPGDEMGNLSKEKIAQVRQTGKDKMIVGYVSVGEDDQPPGGPPLKGEDTSGPIYSPGEGKIVDSNNGYPDRFLDQKRLILSDNFLSFQLNGKPKIEDGQDGHPDENGVWGSYYVNAGDTQWRELVFAKMDKLVELGVDGFFLDTVDTASPWGDYGWTSEAMLALVKEIRERYPDKKIVGNRGLFYLNQDDRYANLIDAVLFESLLTHYNWNTEEGELSPWAKWHVQALEDEVAPSIKKTDLHLLVLDYLNPEQEDATVLVQSDRTLLKHLPHSLSFSHPNLQVTGWTPEDLLPGEPPESWPTLKTVEVSDEGAGRYTLKATFDSEVPKEALPDIRITKNLVLPPERAPQLAPAQIQSWNASGKELTVTGNGLNKSTNYRAFLRLVSKSPTPQTGFGWQDFTTKMSELPSQVEITDTTSTPEGLRVTFKTETDSAESFRVYRKNGANSELLKETKASPALLDGLQEGEVARLYVVGVTAEGREGYPSRVRTSSREDVTPPPSPGEVTFSQDGSTSLFRWEEATDASGYRLYVVPEKKDFRLPAHTEDTELEYENIVPGRYTVYLTAVDGAGNQSRPGPRKTVEIR